jgi:hypothetical protein
MIPRDKHILDAFSTMTANLNAVVKELQTESPDMKFVAYQMAYTVSVLNDYIPIIFDKNTQAKIVPLRVVRSEE